MAIGDVQDVDRPLIVGYLDALRAAGGTAADRVGGWRVLRIAIADRIVEIRAASDFFDQLVRRSMGHILVPADSPRGVDSGSAADAEITVWDSASTGVPRPEPPFEIDEWRCHGDDAVLHNDQELDTITITDLRDRRAVYWLADESGLPPWEHPAPYRSILERLFAHLPFWFVHGAVIGNDDFGILVPGAGGKGKSTLTTACAGAGLTTLGDDFVVLGPDPRTEGHSLYATARLRPDSPAWNPSFPSVQPVGSDKHTVYLAEAFPSQVRASLALAGIAIPVLRPDAIPGFAPARRFDALFALAPSSLNHVDGRPGALAAMRNVVGALPCFEFTTGPDLEACAAAMKSLLEHVTP